MNSLLKTPFGNTKLWGRNLQTQRNLGLTCKTRNLSHIGARFWNKSRKWTKVGLNIQHRAVYGQ